MKSKIKSVEKSMFVILLAISSLILTILVIEVQIFPLKAIAQSPSNGKQSVQFPLDRLSALGIDTADLNVANSLPYDLTISKTSASSEVVSGDTVIFDITITNIGANPVSYALFQDKYPPQMQDVVYNFGSTTVISDGNTPPLWLLPDPINPSGSVQVTVSGTFTSGPDVTVKNIATIDAFNNSEEITTTNNSGDHSISILGFSPGSMTTTLYIPLIAKAPPGPKLQRAYFEDFEGNDNHWVEFDNSGCKTENRNNQFWVDLNKDDECFPPTRDTNQPETPYRTYGEFEVTAYHSEDRNDSDNVLSDADYGLFINGEGGGNQYIFKISPNSNCSSGGDWQLIRNRSNTRTTLRQGFCNTAIKRGGQSNTLRIAHNDDRILTVYVNGQVLGEYVENSSSELRGRSVGIYIDSSNRDVRVKFDNFIVDKYVN